MTRQYFRYIRYIRFFFFTNTECTKETEVFRISCFRHLEKPIKTKEHKIKHLFLYVFESK